MFSSPSFERPANGGPENAAPRALAVPKPSRRMKRRLLRQAVDENVTVIEGRRPKARRSAKLVKKLLRLSSLVLALGLALASSHLIALVKGEGEAVSSLPRQQLAAHGSAVRGQVGTRGRGEGIRPVGPDDGIWPQPQPIDSSVFPLAVRKVVLDPGHGGRDQGSTTAEGLFEKDLALDIGLRLRDLIAERQGLQVLMTRQKDEFVLLKDRTELANESGADLFISIHVNWFETRQSRGVETYFRGTTDDPFLIRLASQENRMSGYSLADVRRLLDGIYLGLKQEQSRKLAQAVQGELFRSLRRENPAVEDRGIKSAPFLVLVETEMPGILAEVSCLSNQKEAELLAKPLYRQTIAEALLRGVVSYAENLDELQTQGS